MMVLAAGEAVGKIAAQREFTARKGQLVPGNVGLIVQSHLQTLRSGRELRRDESGPEHHVHLSGVRDADHGEQGADLDSRQGFLVALARRRVLHGLTVLHEPRRYGPEAETGLDGAAAKQHLAPPYRDTAQHQQRILVVHHAAARAHEPRQMIPIGYFRYYGRAAVAAEIQMPSMS